MFFRGSFHWNAGINNSNGTSMAQSAIQLVSIEREQRTAIPTLDAAAHLCRSPQTLRIWACRQVGPLQPMRINGRLAWPVADIKRLLGVQ
mgnify:CR=1 FL=1